MMATSATPDSRQSASMGDNHGRSVLVVDDEDTFRDRLVKALCARGFEATGAASAEAALCAAQADTPECAIVDLRVPRLSGLHVVRGLRQLDPTTRIVVLTGYGSIATALDAPADEPPPTTVPSLDRVEWEHIDRVLLGCGGNITQAAALLGLHRRSLQRKLMKRPSQR